MFLLVSWDYLRMKEKKAKKFGKQSLWSFWGNQTLAYEAKKCVNFKTSKMVYDILKMFAKL